MKRKKIVIDIDDVLSDFAEAFVEYSNDVYGTSLSLKDYSEDLQHIWGVSSDEVGQRIIRMNESGIALRLRHKDYAKEVLEKLKKRYNLIIVTSRIPDTREMTLSWINDKFPKIFKQDNIYFIGELKNFCSGGPKNTKGDFVKQIQADYLIDDQIKHCTSAAALGVNTLLFGKYSKKYGDILPDGVTHILDWKDVERYFDNEK